MSDDAQAAAERLRKTLVAERAMRLSVLKEPRRSIAAQEINKALEDLTTLEKAAGVRVQGSLF